MVSFKSVHDAKQFPPAECHGMVYFVVQRFAELGLRDVKGHETPDGSQAICGHKPGPPGSPTVLLYFHHDAQPPLDNASWETPVWDLTEKNGRWYGRGAADCKGIVSTLDGPGYESMTTAMRDAYGRDPVAQGQGGSIPLCNVFADTFPNPEIMLIGVEEPLCLIHAPNESVDPTEIENLALVEALFLQNYAAAAAKS
jgi:acetylornithine deacetylase/succinyl-diaminopimelate desuccinylase-like protein